KVDRVAAVFTGDLGRRARSHTVEEVFQLGSELIAFLHVEFADFQVMAEQLFFEKANHAQVEFANVEPFTADALVRLNDRGMPLAEVEADIAFRRIDVHFAERFDAGPTGGQVGHAAVLEGQPSVGNVFIGAEQTDADCVHRAYGRTDECEQHIEVVDHQIEHNADVERPAAEVGEPFALDKLGPQLPALQV